MVQAQMLLEGLLLFLAAWNPACVATQHEFLQWGPVGHAISESTPVPAETVWFVKAAGVFTNDNTGGEFMMELVHPVASQGGVCCWRVAVERTPGWTYGTPVLALSRPLLMSAGDRLAARGNGVEYPYQVGITFIYYELPASCLLGITLNP